MNNGKLSGRKISLATVLSLGFIIFGVGCISWSIVNIWLQSNNSTNSNSVTSVAKVSKSKGVSITPVKSDTNKTIYPVNPKEGENLGSLTIPALNRKLPIIQGTGTNDLKRGVGHFSQSVLPGQKDNCVLSGHRDTVFRELGNLKIGDQLIVQTATGIFTYAVKGTRIVHEDDKTVIVPIDHAVLTVTTCYPFDFIGNAPDRYIVSADLVKTNKTIN